MLAKKTRRRVPAALFAATVWFGASATGAGVGAAGGQKPPPPLRDEIRCAGTVCTVGACVTQQLLVEPSASSLAHLRIIPNQVAGKAHGLKLFGIRPGSLAAQLGLHNGDTLLTVNGSALDDPESALSAYARLTDATELTLGMERAGQPLTRKLHLDRRPLAAGDCPAAPPAAPPAASAPPIVAPTLRSLAKDISCTGTRCVLANGVLDRALGDAQLLLGSARAVPVVKDGKSVGVKLMAIRPGSLWALLGLKNGDLVRSIDQYSLGKPEEAMAAYAALRSASELHLALERAGAPLTITYVIQR